MNLLSKSSGPGGASSETTLTRANLTHSNPNQIHNSDFGSHFVFSIPTTHTPNNLSSHTVPWIIDSEAIDYISCSLDCFYTYFTIAPIKIHLPNEFTVQAHILGSIKFTPDFIIHNVLFVPDFSFNLLSIPKLLYTFPCRIIFSSDLSKISCELQDMSTLKTIGLADLKEGLFHLIVGKDRSPSTNNITPTNTNNSQLWHFRLGHVSGNTTWESI